jgi:ribokinase
MQKPIITVVGSFAVGMTLRTNRMPIFGETLIGSDFDMGPGGKGSNQAVAVARLGADSYLVGIIGKDKLGEIGTDLYAREGVNTQYLKQTDEMATGVGFIILDPAGRNGIILDMSANKLMDEAYVDLAEDQIANSRVVMSVLEIPAAAAGRAMALGRKHGVLTVLNPAPAVQLSDQIIQNVDVITPNETELRILLGLAPDDPTPTRELAYRLKDHGIKNILVTMGEKGSLVLTQTEEVQVPSVQVKVVDTTGAGDSYNAGLAIALAEGKDIVTAARFAACSGALACTHLGVIPSLPTRSAVEELYRNSFK